jgi:DNA invertase Pin-like site-specific DNA recombinase
MRIVAYLRVSSKAQDSASQRDAITRAALASGDVVAEWYSEKQSGKSLDRPELTRLRADARQGRIAKVYLFRLDRLTRSGVADTFRVVDELRKAGVCIVSVSDALTIKPTQDDLASEVLIFALSLASRIERTAINERIASARTRIEATGGAWGRPARVKGDVLAQAVALQRAGRSVREISVALKVPKSTIARALASELSRNDAQKAVA